MMDQINKINDEIKELQDRLDWCYDNYSGCDWCCGGGDEEVVDLGNEIEGLEHQRKVIRLRLLRLRD